MAQTTKTDAKRNTGAKGKVTQKKQSEATPSAKEMAEAEPPKVHAGSAPASFRVSKKLTPLRRDYSASKMTPTDDSFLRDCIQFADSNRRFPRLNADAGRLGRLYTLGFVSFDEIGVYDRDQVIQLTDKADNWTRRVTASDAKAA